MYLALIIGLFIYILKIGTFPYKNRLHRKKEAIWGSIIFVVGKSPINIMEPIFV